MRVENRSRDSLVLVSFQEKLSGFLVESRLGVGVDKKASDDLI